MVHLWNNRDSHGLTVRRLDFWEGGNDQGPIEGHDVEKASEMVDAMQFSRVGTAYLALTVAPATEGKHAQIVQGLLMRPLVADLGKFLVIAPSFWEGKSDNNRSCSRRYF